MKAAMLISINWETEEVLHQKCKDELQAFGLLASIRDDFPHSEGWTHHIVDKRDKDALTWLKGR